MDDFSLRPDHRSASAPLDSDEEDSVSADASFRSGFESANTSLVSGVRIAEADTSAVSDVSDADYESAAEATDHDVSFDGEIHKIFHIQSDFDLIFKPSFLNLRKLENQNVNQEGR